MALERAASAFGPRARSLSLSVPSKQSGHSGCPAPVHPHAFVPSSPPPFLSPFLLPPSPSARCGTLHWSRITFAVVTLIQGSASAAVMRIPGRCAHLPHSRAAAAARRSAAVMDCGEACGSESTSVATCRGARSEGGREVGGRGLGVLTGRHADHMRGATLTGGGEGRGGAHISIYFRRFDRSSC